MTTVSVPDGITGFHKLLVRTRGLSIDTPQFYRVWVKLWAFDRPSIYPRKPGFAQEDSDLLSMCSVFFWNQRALVMLAGVRVPNVVSPTLTLGVTLRLSCSLRVSGDAELVQGPQEVGPAFRVPVTEVL